jgi:pyruvyltransferase
LRLEPGIRIIDVENDIEKFIDEVCACKVILSSSLHGLICADAYRKPRLRLVLGNRLQGGDFKFMDYHSTLVPASFRSIAPTAETCAFELVSLADIHESTVCQEELLAVCPFRSEPQ